MSTPYSYLQKDLFTLELFYDEEIPGVTTTPQKNGNIAGVSWQVKGRSEGNYAFTYDTHNRLTKAIYADRDDGTVNNNGRYNTDYNYDKRGNMTNIKRNGMFDTNGCTSYGMIDNLNLTYFYSNELYGVKDNASNQEGYNDVNGSQYDHNQYDANGNMTSYPDKNITIEYNHLNLPKKVSFNGSPFRIDFTYDAAGNLLRRQLFTYYPTKKIDYVAGIEYLEGQVHQIMHSEGFVQYTNGANPQYHYTINDHLGNTRLVYSDFDGNGIIEQDTENNEIVQENHYYPFGMKMKGPWMGDENAYRYKYNGIEEVDDFGLDLSFATFRTLDPAIGRWLQVDPMAEATPRLNPYNSMGNNPILYNDPDGDFIPQLIGAVVGGTVNLVDQALKGNVTSFGEGLAYFGNGAAAGVAVSFGQVGLARGITAVGNKGIQYATGKFDPSGIDSWKGVAGLALDVGTDLLSPGLTQAISKPLTKALTAKVVSSAIDNAVISGGGSVIKQQLSKKAAEELAENGIKFSVALSDDIVVSASRFGGGKISVNLAGQAIRNVGDDIVNKGVTYHSRVLAQKDIYHNFPKVFDDHIIRNGAWSKRLRDGANWFEIPGKLNGSKGVYQLGINGKNTIFHRAFFSF